jgi:dihydroxyacetone kinase
LNLLTTSQGSTSATRLTADDPHYEVGLGIHGEPGRETLPLPTKHTAEAVATVMVSGVTEAIKSQFRREGGDSVVLLLNNLGALPVLELYVMAKELITQTKKKGLNPVRVFAGTYISSLNMNGISLTVLKLPPSSEAKQVMLECLDMPTLAPAWTATLPTSFATRKDVKTLNGVAFDSLETVTKGGFRCTKDDLLVIKSVCDKIIDSEPLLTEYDSKCGDGDCGLVMKAGAMGVLKFVNEAMKRNVDYDSAALCQQVAISISATMGGTSGGLLELCFRAMSASMSKTVSKTIITISISVSF